MVIPLFEPKIRNVFDARSKQQAAECLAFIIEKTKRTEILCICDDETIKLWEDKIILPRLYDFLIANPYNKLRILSSSKRFISSGATTSLLKEKLPELKKLQGKFTDQIEIYWCPKELESRLIICGESFVFGPWKIPDSDDYPCTFIIKNKKNNEWREQFENLIEACSLCAVKPISPITP